MVRPSRSRPAKSGPIHGSRQVRRAAGLALLVAAGALVALRAAPRVEAQVYVTVIDTERRPVVGLSAEDFAMRDGAVRQPVLDVEPAGAPVSVALVLDGFEADEQPAAAAARVAFTRALEAGDPRHQVVTPPGADGRAFVDRLIDACQALRSAPTDRRVVLAIARRRSGDGAVAGGARLSDAVLLGKVALWTVEVGPAQTTALDRLLGDTTDMSGALRTIVPATAALPAAAAAVANLLLSQYVLTYAWPNPMLSQVSISIRHDRGVVLAPIWTR